MKRVLYLMLAVLVLGLLPAWAQRGRHGGGTGKAAEVKVSKDSASTHSQMSTERSNKGGQVRGLERAEEVQAMNAKADAKRGFTVAPGVEKAEGETSTNKSAKSSTHPKGAPQGKANGKH